MYFLIINVGLSAVRFMVATMPGRKVELEGEIRGWGLGEDAGSQLTYTHGARNVQKQCHCPDIVSACGIISGLMVELDLHDFDAVVHHVMHGGKRYRAPVVVDKRVLRHLRSLDAFAPLHNPPALSMVEEMMDMYSHASQVCVFDTGFHADMPAYNTMIPLAAEFTQDVQRYGFHGISYEGLVEDATMYLQKKGLADRRLVLVHIGNDVSVCATRDGISQNTSMGFSPLSGPIMGRRTGDIDFAALYHIAQKEDMDMDEMYELLNSHGGFEGLTHHSDIRDVKRLADQGSVRCVEALDMFGMQVARLIVSYGCDLDGIDAIVFSGGAGSHAPWLRSLICGNLGWMGVRMSAAKNERVMQGMVSTASSRIPVLIFPSREQMVMLEKAYAFLQAE
ncbi:MAG: acetate/propionate family kinase [Nanoarchaeota archaeon]